MVLSCHSTSSRTRFSISIASSPLGCPVALRCFAAFLSREDPLQGGASMNCFHHPQVNAVAQCARCGKGLCSDCSFESVDVWCYECSRDAAQLDYSIARRRITGLWVFTAIATVIIT